MIPAALVSALAAFDEAALTLLANKGLVRRAQRDVADGLAAVTGAEADAVTVACDGDTVRMDRRGPSSATCTCPAPGICRHRLAAVLVVQALGAAAGPEPGTAPEPAGPAAAADIEALPPEALRKWAGKAAWRAARELSEAGADVAAEGQGFIVAFPDGGPVVRIVAGQGPDGMVSKTAQAARKAIHAAAWLAVRAHLGLEAPAADGEDEAAPAEAATVPAEFLDAVTAALEDVVRLGFNLAPESLEERLFLLSVSSRADALPRLAAMLRTLSANVRSRRRRDFAFDPDGCLVILSDAFLLVSALRGVDGATSAERRDALCGRPRRDYAPAGSLRIVGCGADAWTTPSGARGVTAWFYEEATDRWLTAGLARGANQDPGFDPVRAYARESLWSGKVLKDLSHAMVDLDKAQVSEDGRLSAASGVTATSVARRLPGRIDAWPCLFDDWEALGARLVARIGDEGRGEPVLLRPAALARPAFDDLTQVLTWPLCDKQGRWLGVTLAHGRDRAALVDALQKIAQSGWSGIVVALASIEGRDFRLRPMALVDDEAGYNLGLDDLAPLTQDSWARKTALLKRDMKAALGYMPKTFAAMPPSRASQIVHAAWQSVVDALEIGPGHAAAIVSGHLKRHASRLHDAGFPSLGDAVGRAAGAAPAGAPRSLLTAAGALSLARRLMTGLPYLQGR